MYPVPQRAETQGLSEAILGRWLAQRNRWGLQNMQAACVDCPRPTNRLWEGCQTEGPNVQEMRLEWRPLVLLVAAAAVPACVP